VGEWLARHGMSGDVGDALVETGITVPTLERLERALGDDALPFALRSIGATCRTRLLAGEVEVAATRIHSLVAAIKGFTYMDQSNVPAPVEVRKGLNDTLAVLGGKARRKAVTISIDVPEHLPTIEGFGGELNQVWANLIDNAIDAAPKSGHVDVSAAHENGSVVVRVVDDGPGVPETLKAQIFDPFFTTKPQGEGTGLGLDIARRLVREHGGAIELDSRPGRTEFRVTLPIASNETIRKGSERAKVPD
jgi:signal transduction histidine kinase